VEKQEMLAWQYNTIGVSDGITMGGEGMRFSLQTREIIADSVETVTCAQFHDANITIPGCDKNMPGCVMGMARHNRPSLMICESKEDWECACLDILLIAFQTAAQSSLVTPSCSRNLSTLPARWKLMERTSTTDSRTRTILRRPKMRS
jgi:hypothetical protein